MCINFTKNPINPIIPKPIAVAMAIFWNSFLSGLVHLLTSLMESLANCFAGSTNCITWSISVLVFSLFPLKIVKWNCYTQCTHKPDGATWYLQLLPAHLASKITSKSTPSPEVTVCSCWWFYLLNELVRVEDTRWLRLFIKNTAPQTQSYQLI